MNCPCCGHSLTKTKSAADTVNPFGHEYPHAKLYNTKLTPRLIGSQNWSPAMIGNDDPRNGGQAVQS